jgi:hypothetical protein
MFFDFARQKLQLKQYNIIYIAVKTEDLFLVFLREHFLYRIVSRSEMTSFILFKFLPINSLLFPPLAIGRSLNVIPGHRLLRLYLFKTYRQSYKRNFVTKNKIYELNSSKLRVFFSFQDKIYTIGLHPEVGGAKPPSI